MKTSSPRLRAVWFVLSLLLFILAVSALMDDARRAKRSKVEQLTSAEVVSIRSVKSSGYATIKFRNPAGRGQLTCSAEIHLGPHYRTTDVGDTIFVYADRPDCLAPVWPKFSQAVFQSFMASLVLFFLTLVQAGRLIDAVRTARLKRKSPQLPIVS